MIYISEHKQGRKTYFVSNMVDDNGEVTSQRKVTCPLYQVEKDGFTYFLLYGERMVPYWEVFNYLNYGLQDNPLTTRSKAANALRLLYCFLSLTQRSITELDEMAFGEFMPFIRGINYNPKSFSLITRRSNGTVNGYFAVYRDFFKYSKIECPPLFDTRTVRMNSSLDRFDAPTVKTKYGKNLKTSTYTDTFVPKYISPDDFRKIYRTVIEAGDKQAKIILHLMYGYGMRLGEVLGLTIEDIDEIKTNNKYVPVLWLRNRLSDKKFQYCKGLPHVISEKEYEGKDYKAASGKIILARRFYEEILSYFNEIAEELESKYPQNILLSEADIVTGDDGPERNFYIFLNRYGKPLSDQTWNIRLRKYFEQSGLIIDRGIKENNLSHRFRHGFAMFRARYSPHPVDALVLQKLMRHRSLTSTMVYYNPTPEDEYKEKTEFLKDLYEMLPELKGKFNE